MAEMSKGWAEEKVREIRGTAVVQNPQGLLKHLPLSPSLNRGVTWSDLQFKAVTDSWVENRLQEDID